MKRPGDILRERRQELGLTLQELENSSNIPRRNLKALENDQYEFFAAESYYCGFLKNYAEDLKLDAQILLNAYQNVKIIESPLPMEQLTGNTRDRKPSPLGMALIAVLLVLLAGSTWLHYSAYRNAAQQDSQAAGGAPQGSQDSTSGGAGHEVASRTNTRSLPGEKDNAGVVLVNRYPWVQDLREGLVLRFVLNPESLEMFRPELRIERSPDSSPGTRSSQNSQGFRLVSLNLDQDYQLRLASGKTNSLPLRFSSLSGTDGSGDRATRSYRLDFTLQNDAEPAVLINLSSSAHQDDNQAGNGAAGANSSATLSKQDLNARFQAFREQFRQPVPHAIFQASKPVPLQLQLSFLRDSYIRYQWFGQEDQEFPVLRGKQLLLQGEAPLTLWLSDVQATRIKVNGQELLPEAFQNVFIGRLEWKREGSIARLYLAPGP